MFSFPIFIYFVFLTPYILLSYYLSFLSSFFAFFFLYSLLNTGLALLTDSSRPSLYRKCSITAVTSSQCTNTRTCLLTFPGAQHESAANYRCSFQFHTSKHNHQFTNLCKTPNLALLDALLPKYQWHTNFWGRNIHNFRLKLRTWTISLLA
jgi:hypothetical protein